MLLAEPEATRLVQGLAGQTFTVRAVTEKPYRRSPAPPFMTSTLQQEASRKLRFGAQRTMQVAQRLYEQGWITYMRTDSTTLSDEALERGPGPGLCAVRPRVRPRRAASLPAQGEERPGGPRGHPPRRRSLPHPRRGRRANSSGDTLRLYDLIWKRTVASQMADATGTSAQVRLAGAARRAARRRARRSSRPRAPSSSSPDSCVPTSRDPTTSPRAPTATCELPALAEGDTLSAQELEARSHTTQPPARYTEASLVKALEELGIGRPSTYASILGTIQNRGYVWKKGTALVPSFTAFAVVGLLERYFGDLVDYGFTAAMEDDLDEIADGEQEVLPWLTRFYFGGNGSVAPAAEHPARPQRRRGVASRRDRRPRGQLHPHRRPTATASRSWCAWVATGPYLQRGEDRASIPEDLAPDELTVERAEELLAAPSGDRALGDGTRQRSPRARALGPVRPLHPAR